MLPAHLSLDAAATSVCSTVLVRAGTMSLIGHGLVRLVGWSGWLVGWSVDWPSTGHMLGSAWHWRTWRFPAATAAANSSALLHDVLSVGT
jgi:hypothetical protein